MHVIMLVHLGPWWMNWLVNVHWIAKRINANSRWVKHVILYVHREYNCYMLEMQIYMRLQLICLMIMMNDYTCAKLWLSMIVARCKKVCLIVMTEFMIDIVMLIIDWKDTEHDYNDIWLLMIYGEGLWIMYIYIYIYIIM